MQHHLSVRRGATAPPALQRRSVATRSTAAAPLTHSRDAQRPATVDARKLVDEVLGLVERKDLTEAQQEHVDSLLDQLEEVGRTQQPRPLSNPLLWGNYGVAYTSTRRAPMETASGSPTGGRFRNPLGRWLFSATGLFQSCLLPDLATNKVTFRVLGLLSGSVGLRGHIAPLQDVGDDDTVRVRFDPALVSFGPLHFRLGKPSSRVLASPRVLSARRSVVQLRTTYLDERVRLGKGSRGSLFVFTRGGAADRAGMDKVGLQRTHPALALTASLAFAACTLGALAVAAAGPWLAAHLPSAALAHLGLALPAWLPLQQLAQLKVRAAAGAAAALALALVAAVRGSGVQQGDFTAEDSQYWQGVALGQERKQGTAAAA